MALGAFLAGVMLAESEYRHELELDIEPFKGLLLGLFFIAVGMSIDLGLFAAHRRSLVARPRARRRGAEDRDPLSRSRGSSAIATAPTPALFAVALSQAGEFAFVLFAAAGNVLPPETIAVLNAAVAVSMLTTPFLLHGCTSATSAAPRQPRRARAPTRSASRTR